MCLSTLWCWCIIEWSKPTHHCLNNFWWQGTCFLVPLNVSCNEVLLYCNSTCFSLFSRMEHADVDSQLIHWTLRDVQLHSWRPTWWHKGSVFVCVQASGLHKRFVVANAEFWSWEQMYQCWSRSDEAAHRTHIKAHIKRCTKTSTRLRLMLCHWIVK